MGAAGQRLSKKPEVCWALCYGERILEETIRPRRKQTINAWYGHSGANEWGDYGHKVPKHLTLTKVLIRKATDEEWKNRRAP